MFQDTRNFAFSFQAETPIKKGTFSREDRILLERIVAQVIFLVIDFFRWAHNPPPKIKVIVKPV